MNGFVLTPATNDERLLQTRMNDALRDLADAVRTMNNPPPVTDVTSHLGHAASCFAALHHAHPQRMATYVLAAAFFQGDNVRCFSPALAQLRHDLSLETNVKPADLCRYLQSFRDACADGDSAAAAQNALYAVLASPEHPKSLLYMAATALGAVEQERGLQHDYEQKPMCERSARPEFDPVLLANTALRYSRRARRYMTADDADLLAQSYGVEAESYAILADYEQNPQKKQAFTQKSHAARQNKSAVLTNDGATRLTVWQNRKNTGTSMVRAA